MSDPQGDSVLGRSDDIPALVSGMSMHLYIIAGMLRKQNGLPSLTNSQHGYPSTSRRHVEGIRTAATPSHARSQLACLRRRCLVPLGISVSLSILPELLLGS